MHTAGAVVDPQIVVDEGEALTGLESTLEGLDGAGPALPSRNMACTYFSSPSGKGCVFSDATSCARLRWITGVSTPNSVAIAARTAVHAAAGSFGVRQMMLPLAM